MYKLISVLLGLIVLNAIAFIFLSLLSVPREDLFVTSYASIIILGDIVMYLILAKLWGTYHRSQKEKNRPK